MGKSLYYLGSTANLVQFKSNLNFETLIEWLEGQKAVVLDVETNMTDSIIGRKLITLQFGDVSEQTAYVVQWSHLTKDQQEILLDTLRKSKATFIVHVMRMEYQILKKYGCLLDKIWDTFLAEQCLYAGYDYNYKFFALAEVLLRRYGKVMDKEMQTTFGDDIITDKKLIYAANDVMDLGKICADQYKELYDEDKLKEVTGPYNIFEVGKAFSDMEYNGMHLYQEPWLANVDLAQPIVDDATAGLNSTILEIEDFAKEVPVTFTIPNTTIKVPTKAILSEDTFLLNWNSPKQILPIFQLLYPDLEKTSALELKKYLWGKQECLQSNKPTSTQFMASLKLENNIYDVIKVAILNGNAATEDFFIRNFKDKLIEMNAFYQKGSVMVNWNSNPVKLAIFQRFDPTIKDTGADSVADRFHLPFFRHFERYQFANSLLTKYGAAFIEKNVDLDGRVRTNYNIVLDTYRVSSSKPNLQNIPKNSLPKARKGDYRNCFGTGKKDWRCISADYGSQELVILATLSKDPVFLNALRQGHDLHSVAAEVVYGQEWVDAAESDCAYYELDEKGDPKRKQCNCPKHQELRLSVKTISFGLAYGMSEVGLAAKLGITKKEAIVVQKRYFAAFPAIKKLLNSFALYAMTNGYIRTGGLTNFKRYFPYWNGAKTHKGERGRIERAGMNTPKLYGWKWVNCGKLLRAC